MGRYLERRFSAEYASPFADERRGGTYRVYEPDLLGAESTPLDGETREHWLDAQRAVSQAAAVLRARPLNSLYATLLKSESISSAWIEGLQAPPRDVAVANLDIDTSSTAAIIVANIRSVQHAVTELSRGPLTHDLVDAVHHTLLPELGRGYRQGPVWIGGHSLLRAKYIAPEHDQVPDLMTDLIRYVNESGEDPLVMSGIMHAQYETIHPYADGNGRAGRALIHGILSRARIVDGGVFPVSTILRTRGEDYIRALTAYRFDATIGESKGEAVAAYLQMYLTALADSAHLAERMHTRMSLIEAGWAGRLSSFRSDSTVHRIVPLLWDQPAVTVPYLLERIDATPPALYNSVNELVRAGILSEPAGKYKKAGVYCADQILDALLLTERALASADLDMLTSAPSSPAPPLGAQLAKPKVRCTNVLPRKGTQCVLRMGHRGRCR